VSAGLGLPRPGLDLPGQRRGAGRRAQRRFEVRDPEDLAGPGRRRLPLVGLGQRLERQLRLIRQRVQPGTERDPAEAELRLVCSAKARISRLPTSGASPLGWGTFIQSRSSRAVGVVFLAAASWRFVAAWLPRRKPSSRAWSSAGSWPGSSNGQSMMTFHSSPCYLSDSSGIWRTLS
jgi:hypothetical protein